MSREEFISIAGRLADLPAGYSWGAFIGGPSGSAPAYYVIRDRDRAACIATEDNRAETLTAADLDDAIDAGLLLTAARARAERRAHRYAVVNVGNIVTDTWVSAEDAGAPVVQREGERRVGVCNTEHGPCRWVYVEEPCRVGDRLDVRDDGTAVVR